MENPQEALRLDLKTNPTAVREQAAWCGLGPGQRVLDVGCGSGRTASLLYDMVCPGGSLVGVDVSPDRIRYARAHCGGMPGIEFLVRDFCRPMTDIGFFDVIWVQFVLEYFRRQADEILENLAYCLKPGGTLCLLDLDGNCLNHYPMSDRMLAVLQKIMQRLETSTDFDPYAGRKLYTRLYDLGFTDIDVRLTAHHLLYGELRSRDFFNWKLKLEAVARQCSDLFCQYPGGREGFFEDFSEYFHDPRRFTYTPLMVAKGRKPGFDADRGCGGGPGDVERCT